MNAKTRIRKKALSLHGLHGLHSLHGLRFGVTEIPEPKSRRDPDGIPAEIAGGDVFMKTMLRKSHPVQVFLFLQFR